MQGSLLKVLTWFDNNLITNNQDVNFIVKAINMQKEKADNAPSEKKGEKDKLERNWSGKYPYLHLIHCIENNDDVKHAFLCKHDILSVCLSIENCKSENHDPTV